MEQDLVIPTYQSQALEENYEGKCQILKPKLCVQESHGTGPGDPHLPVPGIGGELRGKMSDFKTKTV
jgi:hypothetical protein